MAIAQLLAPGMQQFSDANGVPYIAGQLFMYIPPATTTFKNTWIDRDEIALNQNPIILDAAGRCVIFGNGQYRQIFKDQFNNTIWDKQVEYIAAGAAQGSLYDLAFFLQGKPVNTELVLVYNATRGLKLPAGLTGTQVSIAILPTAVMTFTLAKNGVPIGTIAFAITGVPTITFVADVSFAAADQFTMTAQAVADATGGNVSTTFVFTVL